MSIEREALKGYKSDLEGLTISISLDTRRVKADNTYPIKLCVYQKSTGKAKYYGTKFHFSPEEFKSIWLTKKPRSIYKSSIEQVKALVDKAANDVKSVTPFSFQLFEEKLFRKGAEANNVFWHYTQRIQSLKEISSIGTASWYNLSKKSLKAFMEKSGDKRTEFISFDHITKEWLERYERSMLKAGRSKTTISMYLRALRAIFQVAIKSGDIDKSVYPFGAGKFEIKEGGKVKKSLSEEEIRILFNSKPASPEQQKAKDFWFFSYLSNGMNIKDIINLRHCQIGNESFVFERIKTASTNRETRPIEVILTDFHRYVFNEYGSVSSEPRQFVFDIIQDQNSPEKVHSRTKSFTRFINQHMKKLATTNGLRNDISSYFARHSFATRLIRKGKSIAFAQEALGHSSSKTTERYFAGFTNEAKRESALSQYEELIELNTNTE